MCLADCLYRLSSITACLCLLLAVLFWQSLCASLKTLTPRRPRLHLVSSPSLALANYHDDHFHPFCLPRPPLCRWLFRDTFLWDLLPLPERWPKVMKKTPNCPLTWWFMLMMKRVGRWPPDDDQSSWSEEATSVLSILVFFLQIILSKLKNTIFTKPQLQP